MNINNFISRVSTELRAIQDSKGRDRDAKVASLLAFVEGVESTIERPTDTGTEA